MKLSYNSIKTGLKTVALSALMAYSLSSCDNSNNYIPLKDQVAKNLVEQQTVNAQCKIDSLETIALKDIDLANNYFNNAVSKKNIDKKTFTLMDSLYSRSRKDYSMIEDIADNFDIEKYPKMSLKIYAFSKDVSDVINGLDKGKTNIEKMLDAQGIKDVKVYNPASSDLPTGLAFFMLLSSVVTISALMYHSNKQITKSIEEVYKK